MPGRGRNDRVCRQYEYLSLGSASLVGLAGRRNAKGSCPSRGAGPEAACGDFAQDWPFITDQTLEEPVLWAGSRATEKRVRARGGIGSEFGRWRSQDYCRSGTGRGAARGTRHYSIFCQISEFVARH